MGVCTTSPVRTGVCPWLHAIATARAVIPRMCRALIEPSLSPVKETTDGGRTVTHSLYQTFTRHSLRANCTDPYRVQTGMQIRRTRSGRVRSGTLWVIAVIAAGCADASAPNHEPPPRDIHLLALQTFDGSGQAVHPDPAETPPSWDGASTQLAVTPYPNADASKENPSLFSARSFRDWFIPEGIVNPIAVPASGYCPTPTRCT